MFAALRAQLSRSLLIASLDLTNHPVEVEGIAAMTIFARLEALEVANTALTARVAELESKSAVDTSGFATTDSVSALGDRVSVIEGEIGTEAPADTSNSSTGSDTIVADQGADQVAQ